MKIRYDSAVDVLTITLKEGDYAESDEVSPGMIVDFDKAGAPLAIEILQARRVLAPDGVLTMEFPLKIEVGERAQRQITTTDREIERLVYELYELMGEEIAIVEGRAV